MLIVCKMGWKEESSNRNLQDASMVSAVDEKYSIQPSNSIETYLFFILFVIVEQKWRGQNFLKRLLVAFSKGVNRIPGRDTAFVLSRNHVQTREYSTLTYIGSITLLIHAHDWFEKFSVFKWVRDRRLPMRVLRLSHAEYAQLRFQILTVDTFANMSEGDANRQRSVRSTLLVWALSSCCNRYEFENNRSSLLPWDA
jgi:hypothetical protein